MPPEAISAAHIASLAGTEAKLVCLSYLGMGTGPAHIRYLVRRLRRILPGGTFILVCFWADESDSEAVKALLATAEADAYAISLQEAVEICIEVATGKRKGGEVVEEPAPPSVRESRQRPSPSGVSGRRRVKSWDD